MNKNTKARRKKIKFFAMPPLDDKPKVGRSAEKIKMALWGSKGRNEGN